MCLLDPGVMGLGETLALVTQGSCISVFLSESLEFVSKEGLCGLKTCSWIWVHG